MVSRLLLLLALLALLVGLPLLSLLAKSNGDCVDGFEMKVWWSGLNGSKAEEGR